MQHHFKKDFFISYSQSDYRWGEWIAWQLEQNGSSVVLRAWDFLPSESSVLRLQEAIVDSRRTIIVLSEDYLEALDTQPEWAAAFLEDSSGQQRKLLPVRVRICQPQGLLRTIIPIDLVGLDEPYARAKLLAGIAGKRAKPESAPFFPGPQATAASGEETLRLVPSPPFPRDLPPARTPIRVFYAYAQKDEKLLQGLEMQLGLLRNLGLIAEWHPGKLSAGLMWAKEIQGYWENAQIILLLVSANFIASDAYHFAERAIKRYETKTARVVPIILSPVDWQGSVFDGLTALPHNQQPITSWRNRAEAFLDVAQGIRTVVEDMQERSGF